jgi:hypothetical protein
MHGRNFFCDSQADAEWRLVLTYLIATHGEHAAAELDREKSAIRDKEKEVFGMLRTLEFNRHEHQPLCEELKHLYTAITRARVRLVIYEQDARKRAPMFHYLKHMQLVEPVSLFETSSSSSSSKGAALHAHAGMMRKTTTQEWQRQGANLLDNGLYLLAIKCFRKSGDAALEAEATAEQIVNHKVHPMTKESKLLLTKDQREAREREYLEAGELFLRAGKWEKAARCFFEAQELGYSAQLYMQLALQNNDEEFAKKAATCLRIIGDEQKLEELYRSMGKFRKLLRSFKDQAKYVEAVRQLDAAPSFKAPPDLSLQVFLPLAAAEVHAPSLSADGLDKKRQQEFLSLVARIQPDSQQVSLLRLYGYRDEMVEKLIEMRAYADAADEMCKAGRMCEACELLESVPYVDRAHLACSVQLHVRYARSLLKHDESMQSKSNGGPKKAWTEHSKKNSSSGACSVTSEGYFRALLRAAAVHDKLVQYDKEEFEKAQRVGNRFLIDQMQERIVMDDYDSRLLLLEIALCVQAEERKTRFEHLLEVCTESAHPCRLMQAIAKHQLLKLGKGRVHDAKDVVQSLAAIERDFAQAKRDRSKELELRQYELACGISRLHGVPYVPAAVADFLGRLHVDVGSSPTVRGEHQVQEERFHESLLRLLRTVMLDALRIFVAKLEAARSAGTEDKTLLALLNVWAVATGLKKLEDRKPSNGEAAHVVPACPLVQDTGNFKSLFNQGRMKSACITAQDLLCPSLLRVRGVRAEHMINTKGEWREEIREASQHLKMYAWDEKKKFEQKHVRKSGHAHTLSRILCLFEALDCETDRAHVLKALQQSPYSNLHVADVVMSQNKCLFAAYLLLDHIFQNMGPHMPINTWEVLEFALAEACVIVSCTASGEDWSVVSRGDEIPVTHASTYMTAESAVKYQNSNRWMPPHAENAYKVLFGALQLCSTQLKRAEDERGAANSEFQALKRHVALMVWLVVLTMLIDIARTRTLDYPRTAWDTLWPRRLHQAVVKLRLEAPCAGKKACNEVFDFMPDCAPDSKAAVAVLPSVLARLMRDAGSAITRVDNPQHTSRDGLRFDIAEVAAEELLELDRLALKGALLVSESLRSDPVAQYDGKDGSAAGAQSAFGAENHGSSPRGETEAMGARIGIGRLNPLAQPFELSSSAAFDVQENDKVYKEECAARLVTGFIRRAAAACKKARERESVQAASLRAQATQSVSADFQASCSPGMSASHVIHGGSALAAQSDNQAQQLRPSTYVQYAGTHSQSPNAPFQQQLQQQAHSLAVAGAQPSTGQCIHRPANQENYMRNQLPQTNTSFNTYQQTPGRFPLQNMYNSTVQQQQQQHIGQSFSDPHGRLRRYAMHVVNAWGIQDHGKIGVNWIAQANEPQYALILQGWQQFRQFYDMYVCPPLCWCDQALVELQTHHQTSFGIPALDVQIDKVRHGLIAAINNLLNLIGELDSVRWLPWQNSSAYKARPLAAVIQQASQDMQNRCIPMAQEVLACIQSTKMQMQMQRGAVWGQGAHVQGQMLGSGGAAPHMYASSAQNMSMVTQAPALTHMNVHQQHSSSGQGVYLAGQPVHSTHTHSAQGNQYTNPQFLDGSIRGGVAEDLNHLDRDIDHGIVSMAEHEEVGWKEVKERRTQRSRNKSRKQRGSRAKEGSVRQT